MLLYYSKYFLQTQADGRAELVRRERQKTLANLAGGCIKYGLIKTSLAGVQAVENTFIVGIDKGRFLEEAGLFVYCR